MNTLRRIWDEIRRGENIDVYVTIVLAAGLSILTITPVFSPTIESLTAILLALLALSSISNLRNLHANKQLLDQLSNFSRATFLREFPSSLQEDFVSAPELWLIGVSLTRTIRHNYSEMEQKLRQGHNIYVLLVHPDGPASEIAASRPYPPSEVEQVRRQIRDSLGYLCKLKAVTPGKLEIRTIHNPLTHGITAINPSSPSGTLYIEEYPYQTKGNVLPRFVLRARDSYWYNFYKDEIRNLWDNSIEWDCSSTHA